MFRDVCHFLLLINNNKTQEKMGFRVWWGHWPVVQYTAFLKKSVKLVVVFHLIYIGSVFCLKSITLPTVHCHIHTIQEWLRILWPSILGKVQLAISHQCTSPVKSLYGRLICEICGGFAVSKKKLNVTSDLLIDILYCLSSIFSVQCTIRALYIFSKLPKLALSKHVKYLLSFQT